MKDEEILVRTVVVWIAVLLVFGGIAGPKVGHLQGSDSIV